MFTSDYPDVLGSITGGARHELETAQCALGVYPVGSAVGQPFEILLLVQSLIDKPQEVVLAARLPSKDTRGNRLSFLMPRKQVKVRLGAGEVGLMHVPVVVQAPTPPATGYPVIARVGAQAAESKYQFIRPRGAGRPPSALSVSPFRLDVLREVHFSGEGRAGELRCRFDVIPGQVKLGLPKVEARYEALWSAADFSLEQGRIEASIGQAEMISYEFTTASVFDLLEAATAEHFAAAGLPLHPGETLFIAKALTYVFEDAYQYEQDFDLHDARWFQWLCSLLVQNEDAALADKGKLAAGELYFGGLYDAVRVGLTIVRTTTGRNYGSVEEQRAYAEKVVQAVQGNLPMDLSYAYLPLIMAGLQLNMRVKLRYENLWDSLGLLEEAVAGRRRLAAGKNNPVFETLDVLTERARENLIRERVPRE